MTGALAVAIGDIEPDTFERCALIRDWLDDLGVERVTLLVAIPAPRLHPFPARFPDLTNWLLDRVDAGDAVAQHWLPAPPHADTAAARRRGRVPRPGRGGHRRLGRDRPQRPDRRGPGAARVRGARLRLHVRAARAPGHPLRLVGDAADPARLRPRHTPALGFGTAGPLARAVSPALVRAGRPARASCCAWTCTRPTSTTPVTSSPSNTCSNARATGRRSPTTTCCFGRRGRGVAQPVKLLVVTPEPIDAAFLRSTLDEDIAGAEVLVLSPASNQSKLAFWVSDPDDAIARPRRRRPTPSSAWRRRASTPPGRSASPTPPRPSTTRWRRSRRTGS